MDFAAIGKALKKLHIQEGRSAAEAGLDRGLNPHLCEPDKSNWETGFDTVTKTHWLRNGSVITIVED
jgi:hypothetical protein